MMTVAETILQQLGGGRFCAMTGAKHFAGGEDSLQFSIPKSKGINKVKITLNSFDLYDVEFWFVNSRTYACTLVSQHHNLYADGLAALFTEATGLLTRL